MYKFIKISILSLISQVGFSQSHFSATMGLGYYELLNIGAEWHYSEKSSVSLIAGSNLGIDNATVWSLGAGFHQVFPKKIVKTINPGYTISVLYWEHEDDLYSFEIISFQLMPSISYTISNRLTTRLEAGVNLSKTIASQRKQQDIGGYPNRANANISLKFNYRLGKNEN